MLTANRTSIRRSYLSPDLIQRRGMTYLWRSFASHAWCILSFRMKTDRFSNHTNDYDASSLTAIKFTATSCHTSAWAKASGPIRTGQPNKNVMKYMHISTQDICLLIGLFKHHNIVWFIDMVRTDGTKIPVNTNNIDIIVISIQLQGANIVYIVGWRRFCRHCAGHRRLINRVPRNCL